MNNIFFENWTQLWHVGLMTIISFLTLFVFIRLSGKRTLAQFNAFDFIVTVALGSTLTYMMLAKVPLVEGILVLLLIIGMQYLFAKLSKVSETMENVINASPQLLFYKGQYLKDSMKNELVTREEVLGAIRQNGIAEIDNVLAVILEPNGDMSVVRIPEDQTTLNSSLTDIELPERNTKRME